MFSQLCGVVLVNLAMRMAISAVIGLFSCKISEIVRRDTPSLTASSPCVMFNAGSMSSRSIAPPWVGFLFLLIVD